MTQQPYRRIYNDGTMFKISKAGFHADLAAEKDLLLSITGRSVQFIDRGVATLPGITISQGASSWSSTLTLTYPDNGGIPLFILEPIIFVNTYTSGNVLYASNYRYYDGSYNANTWAPTTFHPTTLTNTQCVIPLTGPISGQNNSNGQMAWREWCGAFNYMILRKPVTS